MDSVSDMLEELKWETLQQRRLKARVVMAYRIVHGLVLIPDDQLVQLPVHTRCHSQKFKHLAARTNYYKHTFFPSVIPLWKSLAEDIISASTLDDFRLKLAEVHRLIV